MKAYTDLEQSKKLAEILPLESADMAYFYNDKNELLYPTPFIVNDKDGYFSRTYCWSLAALINVLPTTIGNFFEKNMLRLRIDKGENDFNIWYENFDYGDVVEGLDVIEDNLVDACVEMIKKLHEQKLYN